MREKHIFGASTAGLLVVALLIVAFQLGRGREDGDPRGADGGITGTRLELLDGIEKRLERLEEQIASLRGAPSPEAPDRTEEGAPDVEVRWTDLQSRLSTLEERVDGLEEDPVSRGYSFLASENAEMRREGINILDRVARFDPETRAAIRALLADPSARVREQAAQKLRDLEDRESAPQMITLLADPDSRTRRRAVQALAAMDARDAAREIGRNLISDADDAVREAAAEALGRLKSPEATEFLVEALLDRNEAVKGDAITALGQIGATSAAAALRAIYDEDPGRHRRRLVLALKNLGDEAPLHKEVRRLSELVRSAADERVRSQSVRELAILARDASQEVFSQALEDPSPRVRREAERALDRD